jgi:pyruvate dehydrogenase E1 component alpha subunit
MRNFRYSQIVKRCNIDPFSGLKSAVRIRGIASMELAEEKLVGFYRKMLLVRAMEQTHLRLLNEGKMSLMAHLGTGQEAVAIGVTGPLRTEDILFGTHRGVGEYIGKGMSPKDIWLEYLGKTNGPCKGKGSLHLADRKVNIPGLVACLGSDFSMAVGTALASKRRNTDQITLYYVGEGTCNQGDANPAMCMASLWKLPIVFAISTNQFCGRAEKCTHFATEDVAPRAAGYGIPYEIVDGQDIEVTYAAATKAVEHARSGKGPYLVEYKTIRMATHHSGDAGKYIKKEDLEKWKDRDPIDLCHQRLLDRGILTSEADERLRAEVQTEIDEAVAEAFSCPDPTVDDLFDDVYSEKGVIY